MARLELTDEAVLFHLNVSDEFMALHGTFRVPYAHIRSASSEPVPFEAFRGLKFGTDIPGIKVAGTFLTSEGAAFYDMHDRARCVTLTLNHDHYVRAVIEVDKDQDPADLASAIASRLPPAG